MFRISSDKISREAKHVPNTVSTRSRTKPTTVSQPNVIIKKNVNSDLNGLSSTGLDNTKTRRPQPRSNTKNDRVPSASKSSRSKNKEAKSRGRKHKANVSKNKTQQKNQPEITKPKKVGFIKRLATPKPRKSKLSLRWSPTGKLFDTGGKLVAFSKSESQVDYSNGCSKHMTGNLKLLINFVWKFMGTVRFGNDHVATILGFGQFCDSDLEVAFRRDACFVRNLEGVDLLKGGKSKRASHPPKPVPNSRQRLHPLHMDLCGPMRIASINGK
nr:hypothetical protein [Tanacetum cinerariifolium]